LWYNSAKIIDSNQILDSENKGKYKTISFSPSQPRNFLLTSQNLFFFFTVFYEPRQLLSGIGEPIGGIHQFGLIAYA